MLRQFLLVYLILSLFFGGAIAGSYIHLNALPKDTPADYLKSGGSSGKKILVCVGDSITHGHVSADYVGMLKEELGDRFEIVNAGVNGDLAYNVLTRTDAVIDCIPDYITILIGTNDANRSFDSAAAASAVDEKGLPDLPSPAEYDEHLRSTVVRLLEKTDADLAIISPPPIGENRESEIYAHSKEFASIAKVVAEDYGLHYIPLFEDLDSRIVSNAQVLTAKQAMNRMYGAIIRHYIFGYSFDRIARVYEYTFHSDELHLNSAGARRISTHIARFVTEDI